MLLYDLHDPVSPLVRSTTLAGVAKVTTRGYGDPVERDPERARADVLDGYVSRERARANYQIVVNVEREL